jgi:PTH1 family peptidyl-tRNA hydrolase
VKLIVGLGNPGIEYQFTPHNLGFLAVDRIAQQCGVEIRNRQCRALTARAEIAGVPVLLAKPETFMNLSGLSVRELVDEYQADPVQDLLVVYDELDLPLGAIRVRKKGSGAGHNGMKSIFGALGTQEVQRIRLGVAPDHPHRCFRFHRGGIPGVTAGSLPFLHGICEEGRSFDFIFSR